MTWTRRQFLHATATGLAVGGGLRQARAQDFPTRPVTLVVPFAPGGGLDMIARQLQPLLEARLGKPLLIENRPGAGTMIGAASVAKAAPDGYTLLFGSVSPLAIAVSVNRNPPYDPVRDFAPVSMIGNGVFVLVVSPLLGVTTLADFIALAKQKPGQISYGSGGNGSIQHLLSELLQTMAGIRLVHVPYRGDNPVLSDIVAGHIPAAFVEIGVGMPFIVSGKVRALGVTSPARVPAMPEIPTIAEAGVPGYSAVSWQMFVAPAGTPRPVLDRLHAAVTAVLAQPEVRDDFVRAGRIPAQTLSIEEMTTLIKTEFARWSKLVQDAGISATQ
jgi:tripartite-type tricarboxylate transporter receptor subunit TctC